MFRYLLLNASHLIPAVRLWARALWQEKGAPRLRRRGLIES